MFNKLSIILLLIIAAGNVHSQDTIHLPKLNYLYYVIENGDTTLFSEIEGVYIFPKKRFKSNREYRKYDRLIRNIKKVYPYAKLAKRKLDKLNAEYLKLKTDKEKKIYAKKIEKEIRDEFEDELSNLTITQGRILIRLIDRETNNTSYELVKEFRGTLSAIFWQTLARIFGSNLKWEFDAQGEDKDINQILILIDAGVI